MRVLLDTNILVAAFATRGLCQDVFRTVLAEHRLLAGETILEELERILTHKLRIPTRRVREIAALICEHGEVISPAAPAPWPVDDPDDRWVGDNDILDAGAGSELRVVTPRGFWESLRDDSTRSPSNQGKTSR